MSTIDIEQRWLEMLHTSKLVGFCFQDADDGRMVQLIDNDPELRQCLIEYQAEKVRCLRRSQAGPVTYPLASEAGTINMFDEQ